MLLDQILAHVREDFDPVTYGATVLVCGSMLVAHYGFGLLDTHMEGIRTVVDWLWYVALYTVPYTLVLCVLVLRGARFDRAFLWRAALATVVLGTLEWWPYHPYIAVTFERSIRPLVSGVLWNLKSAAFYLVPPLVVWVLADRRYRDGFYGWSADRVLLRPFLPVIAALVGIAGLASLLPGFTEYYPSYEPGRSEAALGIPDWAGFAVYSLAYGVQFVGVETFFRGFLVIGLGRFAGRHAILPMVAAYTTLHLGKPFGEALTSGIGGYLLGVIALRHRCILEGVLLHLALAWAMDGFAWLQIR